MSTLLKHWSNRQQPGHIVFLAFFVFFAPAADARSCHLSSFSRSRPRSDNVSLHSQPRASYDFLKHPYGSKSFSKARPI